MKSIKSISLAVLIMLSMSLQTFAQEDIFAIKTALTIETSGVELVMSAAEDDALTFSAQDIEQGLNIAKGALLGITITVQPSASQGGLFLEGEEIELYQYIKRADIDKLCFVPADSAKSARVSFVVRSKEGQTVNVTIKILKEKNNPPEIEDLNVKTMKNIAVSDTVFARDSDGDDISIQIISNPKKGVATFNGLKFSYQPFKDVTGQDSFSVVAKDQNGGYSREAVVSVVIEKNKLSFYYNDMIGNPSHYAAIKLHENKVFTGKQVGENYFLEPNTGITRGDFIVMIIAGGGMEKNLLPTINTGLPNDGDIPAWLKPYLAMAIKEKIISASLPFNYNEIPTRAEGVVICDRAAKIDDVKHFELQFPDKDLLPDWAVKSYMNLSAYKMLDLHGGNANPKNGMTNSYAADLVWQLYKAVAK